MEVLITGAAGFIGAALCERFLANGDHVVGIDNLNAYYDPALKEARLRRNVEKPSFRFVKLDLCDRTGIDALFADHRFDLVINMAAQAGVRYSIDNPHTYVQSNIEGFLHVLEGCRRHAVGHVVFASSSSVYGAETKMPFSEHRSADHPISLYAATKKSNELMAHCYSHLFRLPTTGLRFFTVYGPWGRPDMALMLFARAMLAGEPIALFNHGKMLRDFTYIDDIVEGVFRVAKLAPEPDASWDSEHPDPARSATAPYRVFNIGNNAPVEIGRVIELLEENLGVVASRDLRSMQPGDVPATFADIDDLIAVTGFAPRTRLEDGIAKFATWYRDYHRA